MFNNKLINNIELADSIVFDATNDFHTYMSAIYDSKPYLDQNTIMKNYEVMIDLIFERLIINVTNAFRVDKLNELLEQYYILPTDDELKKSLLFNLIQAQFEITLSISKALSDYKLIKNVSLDGYHLLKTNQHVHILAKDQILF